MTSAPLGYISINDAATNLGKKPQEIVRLAESGHLRSVYLIDAASVRQYQQETA